MFTSMAMASSMLVQTAVGSADIIADKVLPALAESVKDRAQQVAARQIQERLAGALCTGDTFAVGHHVYRLGDPSGRETRTPGVTVIFEKSCVYLKRVQAPLLDAAFLHAFRDDLIRGVVLLSGQGLDDEQQIDALENFEEYMLALISLTAQDRVTPEDVQLVTIRFAQIGGADELLQANDQALGALGEDLEKVEHSLIKLDAPKVADLLRPSSSQPRSQPIGKDPCGKDLDYLQAAIEYGFRRKGAEYAGTASTPCEKLFSKSTDADACSSAQMFRVWAILQKAKCAAGASGFSDRAAQLKALTDLSHESTVYEAAAKSLEKYGQAPFKDLARDYTHLADAARKLSGRVDVSLLWAARMLSTMLDARDKTEAVQAWLRLLERDTQMLGRDHDLSRFLNGAALKPAQPLQPPVDALRDEMRRFVSYMIQVPGDMPKKAPQGLVDSIAALAGTMHRAVGMLKADTMQPGAFIELVADIFTAVGQVHASLGSSEDPVTRVLNKSATLLRHIASGDTALLAVDLAESVESKWPGLERSLTFGRVLLSAYQAKDVDEAKAIFSAAMSSAASREQRFDFGTVDAGAILSARGGARWNGHKLAGMVFQDGEALAGLFAPFGFILAKDIYGLVLYPIDLGAYLVASNESQHVELSDAVAFGLAPYLRMQQLPLAFGMSVEYTPVLRGDRRQAVSVFGWAGLDLPMYTLK
jgi:hypothetical protein